MIEEFIIVILRDIFKCGLVLEIFLKFKRYGYFLFCFLRLKVIDKGKVILDIFILYNRFYIIRVKVSFYDLILF